MELSTIIEELRKAYMEQDWDSILECINLLADYNDNTANIFEDETYGDD